MACGAGWRVRTTFLGAVRSPWGLSLSRLVGFGTWLPPTYVGARDHRPTAVSAPRFIFHRFSDRRYRPCPRPIPPIRRRPCAARLSPGEADWRPPPAPPSAAASPMRVCASRASGAPRRLRLSCASRRAGHARTLDGARRGRIRDRAPGRRRPGVAAHFSLVAARRSDPLRRDVDRRAARSGARGRSGSPVRAARLLRPARPSHRLRRRLLRPDASPACAR